MRAELCRHLSKTPTQSAPRLVDARQGIVIRRTALAGTKSDLEGAVTRRDTSDGRRPRALPRSRRDDHRGCAGTNVVGRSDRAAVLRIVSQPTNRDRGFRAGARECRRTVCTGSRVTRNRWPPIVRNRDVQINLTVAGLSSRDGRRVWCGRLFQSRNQSGVGEGVITTYSHEVTTFSGRIDGTQFICPSIIPGAT